MSTCECSPPSTAIWKKRCAGRFREDLYYRLSAFTLELPPLRERPMDIPVIARRLLDDIERAFGKSVSGFTDETLERICAYHWPGNVRELHNEIRRMLALGEGDWLGAELLSPRVLRAVPPVCESDVNALADVDGTLRDRIEILEGRILKETLIRHRWNKSRAAQELGLSRVGLRSKLQRYNLERKLKG